MPSPSSTNQVRVRMSPYITIDEGARIIREGGVVAFPTETVYGLGADAGNDSAVERIFRIKGRPSHNPIICHLPHADEVFLYGTESETARLLSRFWPGPLTLLLPHEGRISLKVTAGSPLAGFRVPDHPVALELLRLTARPVAAPSANLSNRRSPTTSKMVEEQLGSSVDGIVEGGPCMVGLESTVVRIAGEGEIEILRPGGVTRENLESLGVRVLNPAKDSGRSGPKEKSPAQTAPLHSPGTLSLHYAPALPLVYLLPDPTQERVPALWIPDAKADLILPWSSEGVRRDPDHFPGSGPLKILYLRYCTDSPHLPFPVQEEWDLSPSGLVGEAARNLFRMFDAMDKDRFDLALVTPLPEQGLGQAINDRLRRAALYAGYMERGKLHLFEKKG